MPKFLDNIEFYDDDSRLRKITDLEPSIRRAQVEALDAIKEAGDYWTETLGIDAFTDFKDSHDNIENAEGDYSVKMRTKTDETKNKVDAVYSAVFGRMNTVLSDHSLISGYKNYSLGGKQFSSGIRNMFVGWTGGVIGMGNYCGINPKHDTENTEKISKIFSTHNTGFVVGTNNKVYSNYKPNNVESGAVFTYQPKEGQTPAGFEKNAFEVSIYCYDLDKSFDAILIKRIDDYEGIYLVDSEQNEILLYKYSSDGSSSTWTPSILSGSVETNDAIYANDVIFSVTTVTSDLRYFFGVAEPTIIGSDATKYRCSLVSGLENTVVDSSHSLVCGEYNTVSGASDVFVAGKKNNAQHPQSHLIGEELTSTKRGQTIVGYKNNTTDVDSMFIVADNGVNLFGCGPNSSYFTKKLMCNGGIECADTIVTNGLTSYDMIVTNGLISNSTITTNKLTSHDGSPLTIHTTKGVVEFTGGASVRASYFRASEYITSYKTIYTPVLIIQNAAGNTSPVSDPRIVIGSDNSNNRVLTSSQINNRITNAINNLTITEKTGATTKTITSISQTNGIISASYDNIAFPVTSVDNKTGAVTIGKTSTPTSSANGGDVICFTASGAYTLKNNIENKISALENRKLYVHTYSVSGNANGNTYTIHVSYLSNNQTKSGISNIFTNLQKYVGDYVITNGYIHQYTPEQYYPIMNMYYSNGSYKVLLEDDPDSEITLGAVSSVDGYVKELSV